MRYIQSQLRGRPIRAIHIIKGPWTHPDATPTVNMVETWCGHVYQDRAGLLPGQDTKLYAQGVSSDTVSPARKRPPQPGVWGTITDGGLCHTCQEVLQIHTEYPVQLAAMDNDALYQEFRDAHEPDYWEGEFTTDGRLRLRLAVAEMERRRQGCGFLSEEESDD